MRGTFLSVFLIWAAVCASASNQPFDPNGYQHPDGSISLHHNGDFIEPYFATKALILAQEAGLDVRQPVQRWIQWLLPRQQKDGRFGRYCRKPGADWKVCSAADADDSMLALWLQLMYTSAPDSGLPKEWQQSAKRAKASLDGLRNSRLGVYHVSRQNHVALFMDNVEVYSALEGVAQAEERFGQREQAAATHKEAEQLDLAIQRVFWNKHAEWFRPSIQRSRSAFYPDVVAQVYPWLADLPMESDVQTRQAWDRWRSRFASEWLDKKVDPHPWGLVAMAALKFGDDASAACWLSRSEPLRYSTNWNVLEESAFQAVQAHLQDAVKSNPSACSEVTTAP